MVGAALLAGGVVGAALAAAGISGRWLVIAVAAAAVVAVVSTLIALEPNRTQHDAAGGELMNYTRGEGP